MTVDAFTWMTVGGLLVAGAAATAAKTLHDFSHHELDVYCRQRKRRKLFDTILDRHENVALAAEALQIIAAVLFILAGSRWIFRLSAGSGALSDRQFAACFAVGASLLLVATCWIPWAIVRHWSAPFIYHTWRVWLVTSWLLWPLSGGLNIIGGLLRRVAGQEDEPEDEEDAFEDEIRTMVSAGERDGLLEADAREMIEGVIDLGDTDVSDIMTPRSDIDALEVDLDWPEILQFVVNVGRTRIPVYEKTLDSILGVLFVKDLLVELSRVDTTRRTLRELLREPWFVPKTKAVDDMLQEFLHTRSHLAIVLDEYHSVAGVVTIEDILEEIVGEIVDESDKEEVQEIRSLGNDAAEVLGKTHLHEINEHLGLALPESDDYDTIAGLVVFKLGRIPQPGESLIHEGVRIEVLEATRRRIERLRLVVLDHTPGAAT